MTVSIIEDLATQSVVAAALREGDPERVRRFFEDLAVMLSSTPINVREKLSLGKAWIARQAGKRLRDREGKEGFDPVACAVIYGSLIKLAESTINDEQLSRSVNAYITLCKWLAELVPRRVNALRGIFVRAPRDVERIRFDEVLRRVLLG